MKNLSKLFFCLTFMLWSVIVNAHPGGHYRFADLPTMHHWEQKTNNDKFIIGNFMMSRNDLVFIEGINGNVWSVKYAMLKGNDKSYTDQELSKVAKLNSISGSNTESTRKGFSFGWILSLCVVALIGIGTYAASIYAQRKQLDKQWGILLSFLTLASVAVLLVACKKNSASDTTTTTTTTNTNITKTDPIILANAFALYKSTVATRWDNTYFYIESTGMPAQNLMVGITNWQQQVPIPQPYTGSNAWSIPLQPQYSDSPLSLTSNFMMGAVAVAVNGVPIFNALNNRGEDSNLIGELDAFGGHCGKADDYHYHVAPLHLEATVGNNPIAIALDGFSVYGSKEPDGTSMQTLDASHGHLYNGVYHYHGTSTFPYMIASMKGKVTLDPKTTAPQNQIIPQAATKPFRPDGAPLPGASITAYTATGTNAYLLTYQLGGKNGYFKYSWDSAGLYTFTITDVNGNATTTTYNR
jgi:hypothetical protein